MEDMPNLLKNSCTQEVYITPVRFFYQSNFWIYLLLQPSYKLRHVSVFLKQGELRTRWPTVVSSNIACSVRWGSYKIFRLNTKLKQASVRLWWECLAVSSLIWKQPLSVSDYFAPKLLPWTTTEMAGDPMLVTSTWGGKVDEVGLGIFSVPWMLMKRETCLAPLQVKHPEDFRIVSFFITVINLSVMWGNIVKNECLLLHSELLFQIQWDNGQ